MAFQVARIDLAAEFSLLNLVRPDQTRQLHFPLIETFVICLRQLLIVFACQHDLLGRLVEGFFLLLDTTIGVDQYGFVGTHLGIYLQGLL